MTLAPLALTMGEPAGIGGEIAFDAWSQLHKSGPAFFVIDDPARLIDLRARVGARVPIETIASPSEAAGIFPSGLPVLPVGVEVKSKAGKPQPGSAAAVVRSIEMAVRFAQSGEAAGIVTNPIQKSALYDAGFKHPGHTEFLAALAPGDGPHVMMLACPALRVVPVTIHVSLRDAIAQLSTDLIVAQATATAEALISDFGIAAPRLAIAGLNPHAGEGGAMGREDIEIVRPAVERLRAAGIDARGPMPPDTMFSARVRAGYDAAITMYHDQGLIPLKTLDVDGGVNVTLGLSIVRTSPDHGTALDIAGKGEADCGSLVAAIRMAADIARARQTNKAA